MPAAIAHCMATIRATPLPRRRGPSTFTLYSSQSGAIRRMIPAQAVPWPLSSRCGDASQAIGSPALPTARYPATSPTAGCRASTPLSITATLIPAPVLPP